MIPIAYSSRFVLDLPPEHKFPMLKYELIKDQLLYAGTIEDHWLFDPGLIDEEIILLTHDIHYWNNLKELNLDKHQIRRIGFPLSQRLVDRSRSSAMGTLFASETALKHGIAFNIAGGTHHAYSDKGEGFCLLNDIAISANYLLSHKMANKILVIDLDVHQGNGTAKIFENNERVFTFSMHCKDNYPLKKETSDLDIELVHGISDNVYLDLLEMHLIKLFQTFKPNFIFYQAGVDILATDKLGKLAVSMNGCKQRDEFVFKLCKENKIPVAVSMGGGYSVKISDIVDAHCNTFKSGIDLYT